MYTKNNHILPLSKNQSQPLIYCRERSVHVKPMCKWMLYQVWTY